MKRNLIALSAIAVLLPLSVFAAAGTGQAQLQAAKQAAQTAAQNAQVTAIQTKITQLAALGDQEISRRLTSMNGQTTKINGFAKLTTAQKSDLTTQIQANLTALTTLKTTIDADAAAASGVTDQATLKADLAKLKTDVKSIVDDYRIFAIFMPKTNLLAQADKAQAAHDSLTALSTKLGDRIDTDKTAGKDVAALSTSLTDMNAKLADSQVQINAAIAELTPLEPASYPAKNQLTDALAKLKAARADFATARTDAATIITGLMALK